MYSSKTCYLSAYFTIVEYIYLGYETTRKSCQLPVELEHKAYCKRCHQGNKGVVFRLFNIDYWWIDAIPIILLHWGRGSHTGTIDVRFHLVLEGNKFDWIHNPTIRHFQKFLAHIILGRGDSARSVNMKELFIIYSIF